MKRVSTVLVCVTAQQSSELLVKAGKAIAERSNSDLEVISVLPVVSSDRIDCQALDRIYTTAKKQGGEMIVYFSDDPILTVSAYAAKKKPITLVTGFPAEESNDFVSTIHMLLPKIPISMVDKEGTVYNIECPAAEIRI